MDHTQEVIVRLYKEEDAPFLAAIFFNTIHHINSKDYSLDQINAWAPNTTLDPLKWVDRWRKMVPIVAVMHDEIVGFAELEANGHIDCFFCHHEFQGRGVGTALIHVIEQEARQKSIDKLFAEVSITAKPFFEARGFIVVKEQSVMVRGVALTNFVMEKSIDK